MTHPRSRAAKCAASAILAMLLLPTTLLADEAPLVGRPVELPFTGAVAGFHVVPGGEYEAPFRIRTSAASSAVTDLEPFLFTLRVHAPGTVRHVPDRLDLRQIPAFNRSFYIEDVVEGKARQNEASTWRWDYRLKARSPEVREIPGVPFLYYNPDLRTGEKGYQVLWSDPLPLRVAPSESEALPIEAPPGVLEFTPTAALLQNRLAWQVLGTGLMTFALVAPPLLCLGGYLLWRWRYPDAARAARNWQSRAARRACDRLERIVSIQGRARAEYVASTLTGYLRERFGLATAEATPPEVSALAAHGLSLPFLERLEELLGRCAAERFQPDEVLATGVAEEAKVWILSVEEELCPRSS